MSYQPYSKFDHRRIHTEMASTRVVSVSTVVGNEATKTASENKTTVERAPFTPLDTSLVSSLPCKKKKKTRRGTAV